MGLFDRFKKKKKEDEDTVFYKSEGARKQAEAEKQLAENKGAVQRGRAVAIGKEKIKGAGGALKGGYDKLKEQSPFISKTITCLLTLIFVGIAYLSKLITKDFADPWPQLIFIILLMATPWLLIGIFIKNTKFKWFLRGLIIILILYFVVTSFSSFVSANSSIGQIINQIKSFPGNAICSVSFMTRGQFEDIYSCWMEEEEQVKKEGTYETLDVTMGHMWLGDESKESRSPKIGEENYPFDIILENKNTDKDFYITITSLDVIAASERNYNQSDVKNASIVLPTNKIMPGRKYSVKAMFEKLPSKDTKFMYFFATIVSEQKGSGVGEYRLVPQYTGYEKSIEFFDPQIITKPGPIDVYVYVYPPVIELDKTEEFDVIINFYNGGKDGIAAIKNVTLIQTFKNIDEKPFVINCPEIGKKSNAIECPNNKNGNCWEILFSEEESLYIPERDSREIFCKATRQDSINKELTDTISVIAEYEYIQDFELVKKVRSS